MKRWLVRPVLAAIAVALVGAAVLLLRPPRRPRPSRATFEQVRVGMTPEEVAATVGGPPGNYASGTLGSDIVLGPRGLGWASYDQWVCNEGELLVLFHEGRALEVHVWDVWVFPRPGLWERFRAWAGL